MGQGRERGSSSVGGKGGRGRGDGGGTGGKRRHSCISCLVQVAHFFPMGNVKLFSQTKPAVIRVTLPSSVINSPG